MAVFRIERTRDYTVMSNHHLRNGKLSLKAKGLLSMMLSLPEAVSYTHLDVYKRQATNSIELSGDAKSFDRVARKWNVDYAFYKTGPDKYLSLIHICDQVQRIRKALYTSVFQEVL